MRIPLLLGHRGVRGMRSTPENTLTAFDFALSQGCDGFEFDVRLSADGQAVICHDARTPQGNVARSSSEKLGLPLFRDVLRRYQESAFLDIELKVAGLETLVVDLLDEYRPAKGYVISSFLPDVLKKINRLNSELPLGLICETASQFAAWPNLPVQFVIPHHKLARPPTIDRLKEEGRKVLVWTVNSAADMRRFAEWSVDGIISDYPKKLVVAFGWRAKRTSEGK